MDITKPFEYILENYNLQLNELPRVFHSFYINQFLDQFNEKENLPFIKFPDKYQTRVHAIKTINQKILEILSLRKIRGFSESKILGSNKNLEIIL